MAAAGVPTAGYAVVTTVEEGLAAIDALPAVIKADGLAAGKGVVIAPDEARRARRSRRCSSSGASATQPVVVEEFLDGEELSLLALCDGERAVPLAPAQDYKRIGDGDAGPNTGGMGSYSPVAEVGARARRARSRATVHQPVVDELRAPRHAVPRRPLRRPDADRRRAAGARVQRALRRPRDAGRAAAAALRPARPAAARDASPAAWPAPSSEWDERCAVTRRARQRGYPASSSSGDVITGLDERRPPASRSRTPAPRERDGDDRHRRRPRAQRDRARRRPGCRPGAPRMLPPT